MESEGGVETARARKNGKRGKGAVDKKATMLVWELKNGMDYMLQGYLR